MSNIVNLMDVLKPELMNIEGRRYRKTPVLTNKNCEGENSQETYYEEDIYYDDEPESCEAEYCNIVKIEGGYREYIKDIPSFYFRFIVGVGNEKRKHLEKQTKTCIQVPKIGCDGDIVISGKEHSGIIAARMKLKTIIEMNRDEAPAGHFLSLQLACSELTENFEEFKKNVLAMKARGVDASLFQCPERLHLTLCLLTFLNNAELEDSFPDLTSITKDIKEKHFGENNKFKIRVEGIEYMNDDPGEVDVLYAKVNHFDGSNKFQLFADELVSTLASSGYLKKQYDRVKLHATIINTLYRDDRNRDSLASKGGNKRNRVTFNAKPILNAYSDFFFGDVEVSSLDISFRRKFDADGRYKAAASISFC